ncbi:hypothetical protein O1L60_10550 [Streptomyces diastatochromogenes]|nr:hypothetical protein [Streptomyces diastatochromogenes]
MTTQAFSPRSSMRGTKARMPLTYPPMLIRSMASQRSAGISQE